MDKNKILETIKDHLTHHPHIWAVALKDKKLDEDGKLKVWKEKGSPYLWSTTKEVIVKGSTTYILLVDSGYGKIALVENDRVVDAGSDFVRNEDGSVIGLSYSYSPANGLYMKL